MSGGIAYVVDDDGLFARRCNPSMVELESLEEDEDIDFVRDDDRAARRRIPAARSRGRICCRPGG